MGKAREDRHSMAEATEVFGQLLHEDSVGRAVRREIGR